MKGETKAPSGVELWSFGWVITHFVVLFMHKDGCGLAWSRQEFIDVENTFPYLFINPCKTEIPWWLFFVFLFLFFFFLFVLLHPTRRKIDTTGIKWQPRIMDEENISDTSALQQVC